MGAIRKYFDLVAKNEDRTANLAAALAEVVRPADVLALVGELGAGKTRFVQGLAEGLGVPEDCYVRSPTFSLIHEYPARIPLYHIDLYRMQTPEEVEELGLFEYFDSDGVSAVEWFDRFPEAWPARTLRIDLKMVDGDPDARLVTVSGRDENADRLSAAWRKKVGTDFRAG